MREIMSKIRKYVMWYLMFSKRLTRKFSFVVLLCLIPAIIPLSNAAMSEDSGMLTVVICSEDKDKAAEKIIDSLTSEKSIIRVIISESVESAERMVKTNKADAAWIFEEDFSTKMDLYTSGESSKPLIRIVEREESTPLQLSRIRLFGAAYKELSYSLYKNFTYENVISETEISESELRGVYDAQNYLGDIIEIHRLGTETPVKEENYLTVPIRGFLALVVMLCAMAAAMYFLQDNKEGKYDWLPPAKRLLPAFALCFSASGFAVLAVWIALMLSGMSVGAGRELLSLILYAFSSTGFCLVLCILFRSPGQLGAAIPGFVIIMLALSPVFYNLNVLTPVRALLPIHYYLFSTHINKFYCYTVLYCVIIYTAVLVLNTIFHKMRKIW